MAPSTKPTAHGKPSSQWVAAATASGGEDDASNGKQRDRAQVEPELPPAHRHRGRVDDRRQHEHQDEVGRELQRRQSRNEGERQRR